MLPYDHVLISRAFYGVSNFGGCREHVMASRMVEYYCKVNNTSRSFRELPLFTYLPQPASLFKMRFDFGCRAETDGGFA